MVGEGVQNRHVENNNGRLNGIHYDSSYDDRLNTPAVPSLKRDERPHISQLTMLRKQRAARSDGAVKLRFVSLPDHVDASRWIISHVSGSTAIRLPVGLGLWNCSRAGGGVWEATHSASETLTHKGRNYWPFAFLDNYGAVCFCLGGIVNVQNFKYWPPAVILSTKCRVETDKLLPSFFALTVWITSHWAAAVSVVSAPSPNAPQPLTNPL